MFPCICFYLAFQSRNQGVTQYSLPVPGEGGQFTLTMSTSDQNHKLSQQQLSQTEFATAFVRYKDVMLECFPEWSGELDAYLAHILGLASSYTGNVYWHYQSLFTKKAASITLGEGG